MTPARNYGPARLPGGAQVTPLARRLAGERGIDLTRVSGSGPHGRVVARDVESAAPRRAEAQQTIPHFYLIVDVDIDRLVALREEANFAAPRGKDGEPAFKLTLNDFIIKLWAAALQRVPAANAVWAGDRILRLTHSDIGVALPGGPVTPLIRSAEAKSVSTISAEMLDLAGRAHYGKLAPNEYRGGASAISNLGMYGVREFVPIINPPHATTLAIGAARRVAVEAPDGGVRFVSQMTVTLSCDHRVVDGALGAELLAVFRNFVEKPVTALV
jgi:pyruvate dehydrogenase E2 component (dihydrolipoamide acetyltransferase)